MKLGSLLPLFRLLLGLAVTIGWLVMLDLVGPPEPPGAIVARHAMRMKQVRRRN